MTTVQQQAARFMDDLHEFTDSNLLRLADKDVRDLVSCMYLLSAIMQDGTVEFAEGEGNLLAIVDELQSAELWRSYINIVPA